MEVKKILVPYNFTRNDQKALDFVIQRYGQGGNVAITLFHAYTAVPKIDVSDKTVMKLINSNLAYLRQKITELEIELDKAKERLIRAGFVGEKVHCEFKPLKGDLPQEIINRVKSGGFSTIVLNHNPNKMKGFFTMSTSKKIMKSLPGVGIHMVV
ncbi:MAG: universal stress protein [Desulfobulbaceae bacterium]|nr:universal stress protein [Desulfobulbaceae bacterium]